jgi:hypothetical protein
MTDFQITQRDHAISKILSIATHFQEFHFIERNQSDHSPYARCGGYQTPQPSPRIA